jgi:hypothetical protein
VRSRLAVAAGCLTPFVGRDVELVTLVERWERARGGEGQNVLVVGEAGVGKSRLVYQLRERIGSRPHPWLECALSPGNESPQVPEWSTSVASLDAHADSDAYTIPDGDVSPARHRDLLLLRGRALQVLHRVRRSELLVGGRPRFL